jgi:hypothetical protein
MRCLNGIFGIFIMFQPLACSAEQCGVGMPAAGAIEVSGILSHESRWGPPNFGEKPTSDSKFVVWIVLLKRPLIFSILNAAGSNIIISMPRIQLSVDQTKFDARKLKRFEGQNVIAKGQLWNAITPGDVTPVVVGLEALEPTDQEICQIR